MATTVIDSGGQPHFPEGVALVFGGSGGIGGAICRRLADHGSDVALSFRNNIEAADEVAGAVEAAGRQALTGKVDLRDAATVDGFVAQAIARFGRIHTVVYAMGADISMVYTADIDRAEWQRTIDGDLTGFFNVVKASLPHMRGKGGSFVAMTSAGLARHPPKDVLSTVPKAAIEALIRGIAREEGRHGIRANAVALGVVDAGLFDRLRQRVTPQFVEAMKNNTALRRFATAREAADAAVFLASSAAGFITGHSLVVDGGYSV